MRILCHRGFWTASSECNGQVAFDRALEAGFGLETDIRDAGGRLCVSHDPPTGPAPSLSGLLESYDGRELPLAINVKADGLAPLLSQAFAGRDIPWFAFDMSGPETLKYLRAGLPYYTRHSDIEREPILYRDAAGVWLDAFHGRWFDPSVVEDHLRAGKKVCIVSPELHGRDPDELWPSIRPFSRDEHVSLCTDRPVEAREFFRD